MRNSVLASRATLLLALEIILMQAILDRSRLLDEIKMSKHLHKPDVTSADSTASVCHLTPRSEVVWETNVERDRSLDLVDVCVRKLEAECFNVLLQVLD